MQMNGHMQKPIHEYEWTYRHTNDNKHIEELIDHQFKKMPLEASLCITGTARALAHPSCDAAIANVHPLLWVEFKNHMFATDLVSHI